MRNRLWLLFSLIWFLLVALGSGVLLIYSYTPGRDGQASEQWPAESHLTRSASRPTLVMFAHPKCPCTRASMEELATLMTRCQGKVDAQVVFFHPAGATEDWTQTDLWQSAAAIPGVTVRTDEEGREAMAFSADTSGHVVLYDARGKLLFSGGITEARGHAGDNDGLSAVVALLNRGGGNLTNFTPTYGCPIQTTAPASTLAMQPPKKCP